MKGTMIEAAPGTWRLRVFVGRDANVRVRHVNRTVNGTKRTAQRELAKLIADVERGQVGAGHSISLGDLVDRWLDDIGPHRSMWTMHKYREIAERSVKPALGSLNVDKLSPRHIDDFYAGLTQRGLSPTSVRRQHALLHSALGRAVKWGIIASNPVDRATPPTVNRPTVSAPSVEHVQRLIAEAEATDPVLATAIALAAVTGARRGELCALRWSDVDWDKRVLRIARSLTVIHQQVSDGPTKTHQARQVAIDEVMGAFLVARRDQQERSAAGIGVPLSDNPYVLSRSANGSKPCLPDGLSHGYDRLAKRLGIATHLHELRHFSATELIAGGMDVRTVAGRLGHADPSVTLRIYSHALEARDREAAGVLGNAVLGAKPRKQLRPTDDPAPTKL